MRRSFSIVTLVAVLGGTAFLIAPAATAQTGYPPPACSELTSSHHAGSYPIGATFSVTITPVCVFAPGANVTATVNGQSVTPPPKTADASGSVSVGVFVESATSLLIDDPVRVDSQCGRNSISVTGPSDVADAHVTHTATFDVLCAAAVPPRSVQGRVAFTGANIAGLIAAALALVGVGTLLVVANRRRRAHG